MQGHATVNRSYKLVWNDNTGSWVAVPETARGRSKSGRTGLSRAILVAAQLLAVSASWAAPSGGEVTHGSATISTQGGTTTIQQSSQNASLSWQGFNVGVNETVKFLQPSATSVAVNRIFDTQGSQIHGRIQANGQIFLLNPNGVLFGPQSEVNVGGLVASTLNIDDASAFSANRQFRGGGKATVVNQGRLTAAPGGYVALLGGQVQNQGAIQALSGTVAMGAGSDVTLRFSGQSLVGLQVNRSQLDALVANQQLIQADGGQVLMSAGAAETLLASVVNNTGVIQARTVEHREGRVVLTGGERTGTVSIGGVLDVSGPESRGGTVAVTADTVRLTADARVDATGATGGGTVDIGGTWAGAGSMPEARHVTVAAGARIDASATMDGNGGSVVVRSDIHTPGASVQVAGTLKARGGRQSGNGGRIETSGYLLDVEGSQVETAAPHGTGGLWLLDPVFIDIVDNGSATLTSSGGTSTLNGTVSSTISASTINAALNGGNNVTIMSIGNASNLADIRV